MLLRRYLFPFFFPFLRGLLLWVGGSQWPRKKKKKKKALQEMGMSMDVSDLCVKSVMNSRLTIGSWVNSSQARRKG